MKTESTRFFCDRCGTEIAEYKNEGSVVVYWTDISLLDWIKSFGFKEEKRIKMDLCPICKTMLVGFLKPRLPSVVVANE